MRINEISDEKLSGWGLRTDFLGAASKRALEWEERPNNWSGEFSVSDLKGDLAFQEGATRRDPSSVLFEDGLYHAWYTKSEGPSFGFGADLEQKVWPWDYSEIWHATSDDGITWNEQGRAVGRGEKGEFDDRSVFTPEICKHDGVYYLVYQTVKSPYIQRAKEQIGIAFSDSPFGPWTKHDAPILSPADNGEWLGDDPHDRFAVVQKGDFDSHKVHDPYFLTASFICSIKVSRWAGNEFGGREIRHGVATSDSPFDRLKNRRLTTSIRGTKSRFGILMAELVVDRN